MFRRKPRPKLAKKWEGDFTTIHKHYKHILIPMGGVALVGTLTAAIALPIMITKIAKEEATKAFEKIIPIGGQRRVFHEDEKINYLAIGDSVTAGYNGFMKADKTATGSSKSGGDKSDYLSYADFLASDLNKKGMLGSYRNFSVSGYTIPQSRQLLLRNQGNLAMLQNTDLITLSIGANDFLSAVQVLDIPFHSISNSGEKATNGDTLVTQINTARDALVKQFGIGATQEGADKHYSGSASSYAAKAGIGKLIEDSFNKLIDITKSGNLAGVLDIQKALYDKVFGLIQLDLATYINELHQAAPNAQIEVMGYAFPFHKLPSTLVKGTIADKGISMMDAFNKFIETLNETTSRAKFVDFFDINKLKEFGEGSELVTYLRGSAEVVDREWDRVMPNVFDIHPSTFGHQVISGHLFETIMRESGIDVPDYQTIQDFPNPKTGVPLAIELGKVYQYAGIEKMSDSYQKALGFKTTDPNPFEIKDEGETDTHFGAQLGLNLLNSETIVKMLGTILSGIVKVPEIQDHYSSIVKAFSEDSAGKAYATMQDRVSGIASSLKPIAKGTEATEILDGLSGTGNIFEKVKAVAAPLAKLLESNLPDDEFRSMIVTLLNDIAAADLTGATGLDVKTVMTILIPGEKNYKLVSDLVAMLVYLKTAPDDSKILGVFKDLVQKMTLGDRANLYGKLKALPLGLITPHGIWLPTAKRNFDMKEDALNEFAKLIKDAAERMKIVLPLDPTTVTGTDQIKQYLLDSGDTDADLTVGLHRIGLDDATHLKTQDIKDMY